MTANEKRHALVEKIESREGKNTYTQDSRRDEVAHGFGDCSSTQRWVYREVLGIDIGYNTNAQIGSSKLADVSLTIKNGIPDEAKLKEGDLFYFRGKDDSRLRGVGHVEMYIGHGELMGHGSGIGPKRHNMKEYCEYRFNQKSTAKLKNKGLICVRRATITDDPKSNTNLNKITDDAAQYKDMLKGYVGISIVNALTSKKKPTTMAYRKTLAAAVGINNYTGTKAQNLKLIVALGGKTK